MIEISQKDFESKIQDIIDGKLTRSQLTEYLKTDIRKLNNKIQELSIYNEDLYIAFINKFPYKSKERDDIDFEALIIEIIKNNMTSAEASIKYNIGERTITRRVKAMEKENPYLIELYREVKENNKHNLEPSEGLKEKVKHLIPRTVKIGDINEIRKKELEELEKTFNYRCQYVSKEQAAQSMGLTANRMYKLLNELYRIKIEEEHKGKNSDKNTNFKNSLKVDSVRNVKNDSKAENNIERNKKSIIREGIGED